MARSKRIPQHSSATVEHYTPGHVVQAAHKIMGGIDLDPASCAAANANVGALAYFTEADDGLIRSWYGRTFCNPPGGKRRGQSQQTLFWNKAVEEYESGRVQCVFFLAFNANLLFSSQDGSSVLDSPICLPRKRLDFLRADKTAQLVPQGSPTHHNAFVFLPPRTDDYWASIHRFYYYCRDFGWTGMPHRFSDADFGHANT